MCDAALSRYSCSVTNIVCATSFLTYWPTPLVNDSVHVGKQNLSILGLYYFRTGVTMHALKFESVQLYIHDICRGRVYSFNCCVEPLAHQRLKDRATRRSL